MTFSVGMRAPSQAELLLDFAEFLAEPLGEEQRYVDPDLRPATRAGEIDADALARVRAAMPHFSNVDNAVLARWFGCFITRYRAAHEAAAPARPISAAQLAAKLGGADVLRNPWSRTAWTPHARGALLFIAGQAYPCPLALARLLAGEREISGRKLLHLGAASVQLLSDLINDGHLQLSQRR
jgi:50S ribosomal protein L16 3-hydroxylase